MSFCKPRSTLSFMEIRISFTRMTSRKSGTIILWQTRQSCNSRRDCLRYRLYISNFLPVLVTSNIHFTPYVIDSLFISPIICEKVLVASVSLSTPLIRGSQIPKYCPGLPVDHQSLGETSSDLVDLDYQLASSSSGEAGRLRIFRKGSLQSMILDANPTSRHPSSFWSVHFPMQRTDPV